MTGEEELAKIMKIVEDNLEVIVQQTAGSVFDELTADPGGDSTPRDTLRATNGWTITNGQNGKGGDPGEGTYGEPIDGDPYAEAAVPEGSEAASVNNDVPYIVSLNNGSSEQAPAGFVDRAITQGLIYLATIKLFTPRGADRK